MAGTTGRSLVLLVPGEDWRVSREMWTRTDEKNQKDEQSKLLDNRRVLILQRMVFLLWDEQGKT